MTNEYAIASREELWSAGALAESRVTHGRASRNGDSIVADDARDDELLARCEVRFAELRDVIESLAPLRQRGVVEVTREDGAIAETSTLTIAFGGVSIVTSPEHADEDAAMLRALMAVPAVAAARELPIVWRGGSAAVLFHEAVGHAAEHGHAEVEWPSWLRVDAPLALRRASFRDVPLARMTSLVASQIDAPFALPDARLEVHLLSGGRYEPLTQEVTLQIAVADLIDGEVTQRVKPFELRASRATIAAAVVGAAGPPLRYPGVICSREGQELVVGSYAPIVLTNILLPPGEGARRADEGRRERASVFTAPLTRPSATLSRRERDKAEHYRKRGLVVRREGNLLLRVRECGEAIDDGATFTVRPLNQTTADALPDDAVRNVADRLAALNPERLIVSEGIAHHDCDGRTWSETSRRIHIALTRDRLRVLIDHADFEQLDDIERIAHTLKNVHEGNKERVRLAPAVTAALLPSLINSIDIEQREAPHDGRGERVLRCPATQHPNVFRPTYRQRPVAMPFHLCATPFGTLDITAPVAIAIVNGTHLLCEDGDLVPLNKSSIKAIGEPQRWYPYAAGSFGAWMML